MANLFILIRTSDTLSSDLKGVPLRLHPFPDLADVQASIAWQVKGGWDRSLYLVATPIKNRPGFMLTDEGKPIEVYNEGWTDAAYANFLATEWES